MATAKVTTRKVLKTVEVDERIITLSLTETEAQYLATVVGATSGMRVAGMLTDGPDAATLQDTSSDVYSAFTDIGLRPHPYKGDGLWPVAHGSVIQ